MVGTALRLAVTRISFAGEFFVCQNGMLTHFASSDAAAQR
ncbi:hypothetical protein Z948_606 [Sulfitobacter donghicola DSW-25 = KCTC 12864 = JCM 14565]|nr:hypothetical protein Z948_606 [Sulfitobacter donghicola DSW-25 = KCTC 12864 = JCM 14565]